MENGNITQKRGLQKKSEMLRKKIWRHRKHMLKRVSNYFLFNFKKNIEIQNSATLYMENKKKIKITWRPCDTIKTRHLANYVFYNLLATESSLIYLLIDTLWEPRM